MTAALLVRQILDTSGLPKARLAGAARVSRAQLDRYLADQTQPSYEVVQRLAAAAGVDLEVTVRAKPRPIPEDFLLVLEFGEMFETAPPKPLTNLGPVWRAAAKRRMTTDG